MLCETAEAYLNVHEGMRQYMLENKIYYLWNKLELHAKPLKPNEVKEVHFLMVPDTRLERVYKSGSCGALYNQDRTGLTVSAEEVVVIAYAT